MVFYASVCVCPCVCTWRFVRPLSLGVWTAPVCPASHLSPLQDKGSSVSGPLLRLLEMIWSVLLSTEKIISSQRGCPSALRAPGSLRDELQSPSCASAASRSDGHTQRARANQKHRQTDRKRKAEESSNTQCSES